MNTSKDKRKCLLACAKEGFTLAAVNRRLQEEALDTISDDQWVLWSRYLAEIVRNHPYFEHELVNNNRSLSWFAKEMNRRKHQEPLS